MMMMMMVLILAVSRSSLANRFPLQLPRCLNGNANVNNTTNIETSIVCFY